MWRNCYLAPRLFWRDAFSSFWDQTREWFRGRNIPRNTLHRQCEKDVPGLASFALYSLSALSPKDFHPQPPLDAFLPYSGACTTYPLSCVVKNHCAVGLKPSPHIFQRLWSEKRKKKKNLRPTVDPCQVLHWVTSQETERPDQFWGKIFLGVQQAFPQKDPSLHCPSSKSPALRTKLKKVKKKIGWENLKQVKRL